MAVLQQTLLFFSLNFWSLPLSCLLDGNFSDYLPLPIATKSKILGSYNIEVDSGNVDPNI
jgi:hypothetical protein